MNSQESNKVVAEELHHLARSIADYVEQKKIEALDALIPSAVPKV